MSNYTMYYKSRREQYKAFASAWAELTKDMDLTADQKRGMALFFRPIARRFGLVQEFKDIGVI